MGLNLSGRRALVTGGSRGVGRAVALSLAERGARVVTCYRRDHEAAESLRTALKEIGGDHHVMRADVRAAADVAALAGACRDHLEGLDILVNNAGVDGHTAIGDVTDDEWRRVIDTNLTGPHLVTQAVLPLLADGGSIVTVGASLAARGLPMKAHYTAAKAALTGWTRSLCKELGGRGIRVNVVAPGIVEPDPGEEGPPPALLDRVRSAAALGRLATPRDVADAVLFLAGDMSACVTGATLYVDSGI